jgi:hypothetical protein
MGIPASISYGLDDDAGRPLGCRRRFFDDTTVYATAIARRLQQRLLDTLSYAATLHMPGATLIAVDQRYYTTKGAVLDR